MKEHAYTLITPYSILKSRTGGIIGRILQTTGLNPCAVKMYAPSDRMVDAYLAAVEKDSLSEHNRQLFKNYINQQLRPKNLQGISNRCLVLFLEGENAASVIKRAVGHITHKPKGDTIRGTYGDYITHDGNLVYFEPAVLNATDGASAGRHIQVFKDFADSDGGVVESSLDSYVHRKDCETTLVMLKPDILQHRSARPGNIIDMLSKTGLYIVGARLTRFSVNQARQFYKPIQNILVDRLEGETRRRIASLLGPNLPFKISSDDLDYIAHRLRVNNAQYQFNLIIEYITGLNPEKSSAFSPDEPGREKCLILLYHGKGAIKKIRDRLGATDPQQAENGTVRHEFGQNIMKNGIHASDSCENALRERKVVGLDGQEPSELDLLVPVTS